MAAAADDDAASFDDFFRNSKRPLVSMAYVLTGDLQVAQDLTQEALLRAWSRRGRVRTYDDPRAWTRRVLRNLIVSKGRSDARRRTRFEDQARDVSPRTRHTSCWLRHSAPCPRTR